MANSTESDSTLWSNAGNEIQCCGHSREMRFSAVATVRNQIRHSGQQPESDSVLWPTAGNQVQCRCPQQRRRFSSVATVGYQIRPRGPQQGMRFSAVATAGFQMQWCGHIRGTTSVMCPLPECCGHRRESDSMLWANSDNPNRSFGSECLIMFDYNKCCRFRRCGPQRGTSFIAVAHSVEPVSALLPTA